jgi:hypothetical protein
MPESTYRFVPLPQNYLDAISSLRQHVARGERELADFGRDRKDGIREKTSIFCFRHALDIANGCMQTATARLPDSTTTLVRAMLETLIWSRYVTLSALNAQSFGDGMHQELQRIVRKNVAAGFAHIEHEKTGADMTGELLDKMSKHRIPARLSIQKAADAAGLSRVYTNVYGFMSMVAHGKGCGLRTDADCDQEIYSDVCMAIGVLECIEVITCDWVTHARLTPREFLTRALGVLVEESEGKEGRSCDS